VSPPLAALKSHLCIVPGSASPQPPPPRASSSSSSAPPRAPAAFSPESPNLRFLSHSLHRTTGVPHHVRRGRGHQLRDHHQGEAGRRPPPRGPRAAAARAMFGAARPDCPGARYGYLPPGVPCPPLARCPGAAHSLCAGEGAGSAAGRSAAVREPAEGPGADAEAWGTPGKAEPKSLELVCDSPRGSGRRGVGMGGLWLAQRTEITLKLKRVGDRKCWGRV
jgi:hypothetical protein